MYCNHCGKQIDDYNYCPHCGTKAYAQGDKSSSDASPKTIYSPKNEVEKDEPSFAYAVLGFLFPLVGLILYLVWESKFPLRAKSCGKGALISVIIEASLAILTVIFFFILIPLYLFLIL